MKEEQNIKCKTDMATEEPSEFDLSGSGSGNDRGNDDEDDNDDYGDDNGDGSILSDTDKRLPSNSSIPTTSQR